jgi:hypothetical protein
MFFSLLILLSSLILCISVSAPVKQNQKSAEESRMGRPALRQYIGAMMHLAPIGTGVQICGGYNFQFLSRIFFLCSPRIAY